MSLLDRKLVKVEIAHLPHGSKVLIPIMKVPKELFSNVDTESGSGQALHLCRKHVNVQVSPILLSVYVPCLTWIEMGTS